MIREEYSRWPWTQEKLNSCVFFEQVRVYAYLRAKGLRGQKALDCGAPGGTKITKWLVRVSTGILSTAAKSFL